MEEKIIPHFVADDPLKRIKANLLGYNMNVNPYHDNDEEKGWMKITTRFFDVDDNPIVILCAEVDLGYEYFLSDAGQFMSIIDASALDANKRIAILEVLEKPYIRIVEEFRIKVSSGLFKGGKNLLPQAVEEMAMAIARVSHALKPSPFLRNLNKVLCDV